MDTAHAPGHWGIAASAHSFRTLVLSRKGLSSFVPTDPQEEHVCFQACAALTQPRYDISYTCALESGTEEKGRTEQNTSGEQRGTCRERDPQWVIRRLKEPLN